jgi:hypothetical protein
MSLYQKLAQNNKILLVLLLIITLNYLFFNYRLIFRQNAYIAADWLINYQGGFVRRGLIGEIIFFLAYNLNIHILKITYLVSSFFFLSFIYTYYQCIKAYLKFNFLLLYLFLPSTLLFTFFDPLAIGRKEILVLLFISLYTFFLIKNLNSKFIIQLILSVLILITTLSHEIMFFYVPYLFAIKLIFLNNTKINLETFKNFYFEFILFFISFVCVSLIILFSHLHDNNLLCKSLLSLNLNEGICSAVIAEYKDKQSFSIIFPYFLEKNYFTTYGSVIFLNFLPILSYFFLQKKTKEITSAKFLYMALSFICFFFTLPIFMIVNDWGRYLNIHFVNHGLLFALTLKNYSSTFKSTFNQKDIFKKLLIIIAIFLYLTSWFMPHCCRTKIGDGYKSIYSRISFRLLDDSNETLKYGIDYPRLILRKVLNLN